jgi:glutathione S-transferase
MAMYGFSTHRQLTFTPFLNQYPVAFGQESSLSPVKKTNFEEALSFLDHYIKANGGYVAGDKMTIADFSCVASVSSFEVHTIAHGVKAKIFRLEILSSYISSA